MFPDFETWLTDYLEIDHLDEIDVEYARRRLKNTYEMAKALDDFRAAFLRAGEPLLNSIDNLAKRIRRNPSQK